MTAKCPICGRPSEPAVKPFCSKRCADVDLGRWFKQSYVVPGVSEEEEGEGSALDPPGTSRPLDPDS